MSLWSASGNGKGEAFAPLEPVCSAFTRRTRRGWYAQSRGALGIDGCLRGMQQRGTGGAVERRARMLMLGIS